MDATGRRPTIRAGNHGEENIRIALMTLLLTSVGLVGYAHAADNLAPFTRIAAAGQTCQEALPCNCRSK